MGERATRVSPTTTFGITIYDLSPSLFFFSIMVLRFGLTSTLTAKVTPPYTQKEKANERKHFIAKMNKSIKYKYEDFPILIEIIYCEG